MRLTSVLHKRDLPFLQYREKALAQRVAQSAITARWFTGKELAMAFGITLTVSRLGTLFSFNVEELVAARLGYRGALWVAAALCLASLAGGRLWWLYCSYGLIAGVGLVLFGGIRGAQKEHPANRPSLMGGPRPSCFS